MRGLVKRGSMNALAWKLMAEMAADLRIPADTRNHYADADWLEEPYRAALRGKLAMLVIAPDAPLARSVYAHGPMHAHRSIM